MEIKWDETGKRLYETGVSNGVLYVDKTAVAWNGLTGVSLNPEGAEAKAQYADNIKYLSITSAEEFKFTIEAFTYPTEFEECDGSIAPFAGLSIGQQDRKMFGFSYVSLIGNDVDGLSHGSKLHLIYGCLAAPSKKEYKTVNDSPEAISFSWDVTTTPVGVDLAGQSIKPTAHLSIDSSIANKDAYKKLTDMLYGRGSGGTARLPEPSEVIKLFNTPGGTGH